MYTQAMDTMGRDEGERQQPVRLGGRRRGTRGEDRERGETAPERRGREQHGQQAGVGGSYGPSRRGRGRGTPGLPCAG